MCLPTHSPTHHARDYIDTHEATHPLTHARTHAHTHVPAHVPMRAAIYVPTSPSTHFSTHPPSYPCTYPHATGKHLMLSSDFDLCLAQERMQGSRPLHSRAPSKPPHPREESLPFPATSWLKSSPIILNLIMSQPGGTVSPGPPPLGPLEQVFPGRGLNAYITLVPFGRMKNHPAVHCKQA